MLNETPPKHIIKLIAQKREEGTLPPAVVADEFVGEKKKKRVSIFSLYLFAYSIWVD